MKRRLTALAKAVLSTGLIAWILSTLDGVAIYAAIRQLAPWTACVAIALIAAQAMLIAWRWHRIVVRLGGSMAPVDAVKWVFVGLFFNNVLPASIGGDAVRVWLLRRSGAPLALSAGSVVIERGTGLVMLGLMVSACVPAVWADLGTDHPWGIALALVGPVLLAGLMLAGAADLIMGRWLPARIAGMLQWFGRELRRLCRHPGALLEFSVLGVAASFVGLLAAWVLGRGLGVDVGLAGYVALVGGSVLLSALPISLGGWGVRELGMVALFGAIGVRAEPALALSLLWGLLPLLISLPAGLLWWHDAGRLRQSGIAAQGGPQLPPD